MATSTSPSLLAKEVSAEEVAVTATEALSKYVSRDLICDLLIMCAISP